MKRLSRKTQERTKQTAILSFVSLCLLTLISTISTAGDDEQKPIGNPFGDSTGTGAQKNKTILFRGKNMDGQSVEVELPQGDEKISDLVIPMGDTIPPSQFSAGHRQLPQTYSGEKSGYTDREIASRMPHNSAEDEWRRTRVEGELGLGESEEGTPKQDASYLAGIDQVKQLYRGGRYEGALIESDKMIRLYPTDPRLHEMRGTLLDRMGYHDMALDSWNESLKLNPNNRSLKKYFERKSKIYRQISGKAVTK